MPRSTRFVSEKSVFSPFSRFNVKMNQAEAEAAAAANAGAASDAPKADPEEVSRLTAEIASLKAANANLVKV